MTTKKKLKPPKLIRDLQRAIKASGLSQAQVAERAGVSTMCVSWLMTGSKTPTLDTIERIAKAIGWEVAIRRKQSKPAVPAKS